jgi:hypothetical protein
MIPVNINALSWNVAARVKVTGPKNHALIRPCSADLHALEVRCLRERRKRWPGKGISRVRAEQHRRDVEHQLIDEVRAEQTPRNPGSGFDE